MSRIVTLVCVLLLVVYGFVSSGQAGPERTTIAEKPKYSWRHGDSSLALLNHGRIVWQLNFGKKEGKPCFHPIGLIDGTELTWLRPADHRWHRALWFSWKYINGLNYWEEDPRTGLSEGRTEVVKVKFWWQNDWSAEIGVMLRSVDIEMMLSYHRPGEPAVLTEKRLIAVSAPDKNGQYHIDWHSTFTAGEKDVVLDRTPIAGEEGGKGWGGYAGLSVRMAKMTCSWQFVDSEGRKDKEAHGKRARWVDFSGEISGDKAAGIAIFDHPRNLRHPSPWYVEKGMPFFSPAVLFDKAYTLAAGESLTLRYRILIHLGLAEKAMLEAEWKAFLKTTDIEVRMGSAKKLSALGRAMVLYSGDYEVKFPDDMRALHKYGNIPLKKKDLEWLLENVVYLGKGKTDITIQRNTVLAYDKTLLEEGEGTNVLFGDLRIDFLRPKQLKTLGIKPGQETDVQHESAEKLRQLALAALMYADDHKGKFAADLNKLKPYLGKKNLFEWIVENVEYIGQGKMTDVRHPQRKAVAYDRTLLGEGYGTYVAFMDGHVEFLHPKQVEKLSIKPGQNWPSFRGSSASGIAEGYSTPIKWDVERGENFLWKTPVAGLGHSCPAVWGDRIFVTTAVKGKGESSLKVGMYGDVQSIKEKDVFSWRIYCIDRKSGKIIWEREAYTGRPKVKRHPKSSHANATPCTDGKYVIAFFGSEGLYCYDMKGNPVWEKDLGVLDWGFYRARSAQWGGGSSPVIHKDMVILQCDVQKNSFIAAFNLKDGKQLWKTPRGDVPTWGTPTVYTGEKYSQIIVNGYRHIGGYDIETGKEIWKMKGGGDIPVPTPVVGHGLVYITNAHGRMSPIYAVRLSAAGDISLAEDSSSNEHIAWSYTRGGNYIPTPIVYGDYLYCGSDGGRLSCFEAKTGKLVYRESLSSKRGAFSASAVATDGKIYFTGEKGDIYVVKAGPEFKLLGVNEMNETCMATPAISQGTLFFRTRHHLVAITEKK